MALTFTVAGLQTALDAIQAASTWSAKWTAYGDYALTYAGLVQSTSVDGSTVTFPHPDVLKSSLEAQQSGEEASGDRRRIGRVGVRHRA